MQVRATRRALLFPTLLLTLAAFVPPAIARPRPQLPAAGNPEILPLDQIKAGMKGVAYTIFAGNQIEKFDLEVIGILPNLMGPKQPVILVQLLGPKVGHTGVVAGMSGSPVYIEGKLAGAIALKFGIFTKEALAGVTPIESMLSLPSAGTPPAASDAEAGGSAPRQYPIPGDWALHAGIPNPAYLEPIETPLVFSGFYPAAVARYAGEFAAYGMMATQGGTAAPQPDDAQIQPGDMVGMVLVQGDLSINAGCTVTAVIAGRVYSCGHPLFGFGPVKLPMARGRVLTTLSSDLASTKIMNVGGIIGTINQDRLTAVTGRLGPPPAMIPMDLTLVSPAGEKHFRFELIENAKLTPLLVGLVTFNGLVANTAYSEGTTLHLTGGIDIAGHSPVTLENMFAPTDLFIPDGVFVAGTVQSIFTRVFSNPYEAPRIERIALRLESIPERQLATIDGAWAEKTEAAPGETLNIKVMLHPYRGAPAIRNVPITIPPQASRGATLRVMVSDSEVLNRMTNLFMFGPPGRLAGLEQLIRLLNRERRNDRLYITLLDSTPTLLVEDKELPNAPLSEINILDQRRSPGSSLLLRESLAGEWSVPMNEVISGSTSVWIKIK